MKGLEDCIILVNTLAAVLARLLVTEDSRELLELKSEGMLPSSLGERLGLEAGTVFVSLEGSTMLGKTLVAVKAR